MAQVQTTSEIRLMKGNEALAEAAFRAGMQAYFGYPITPQSEVLEYLAAEAPKHPDVVILQAESELAAINMIHGAAGAGARAMISSSSPGISLMQECLSYMASAQLPALVVNVQRGGPGLGTIQPSQGDYFQAVKGGGHGDYHLIVLAPASVQEMVDFVFDGFRLSEKYRNPAMILADGALGQMMEKVTLPQAGSLPKMDAPWATTGKGHVRERNVVGKGNVSESKVVHKENVRERNIITSLFIQPERMEKLNLILQEKYSQIQKEVRFEEIHTADADIILVAFGLTSRICEKTVDLAREKGFKVGLLRPITLYPFPTVAIAALTKSTKGFLTVEMNAGQMVEDVRLAVNGKRPVEFYGRMGGMIPSPEEVLARVEVMIKKV
jgi:2-oxoglutarate/2-oxoacid ferredoxin oxidoreductase subunit alpha